MPGDELTLRDLNRATLARQLLLARARADVPEAIAQVGGLQAQEAKPPFIGLWTRLRGFRRPMLAKALDQRTVVRATAMRATLHLMAADDYLAIRPVLQPALTAAMTGALKGRDDGLDLDALLPVARRLLNREPRTFGELRALLLERFPDVNERALGYATRMNLPLVMEPTEDRWSYASDSRFTPAEGWIERRFRKADPKQLVLRHLAAFGPATATDVQTWSGVGGLAAVVKELGDELVVLRQGRRTLYDVPDAPRPGADVPAPVRLLPEFDSLLLAHKDRTRIVADEHRRDLVTKNLRVKATFLVDGFVAGTWAVAREGGRATLTISPFEKLAKAARDELAAEAEALLAFSEEDAKQRAVAFA